MAEVLILLATYNGAAYIEQMVESIVNQSFTDWRLILSDDGSTDDTAAYLEAYAQKDPNRVVHYRSGRKFGCAQKHFMHLLEQHHDAPYIMFCDQDDVWHKDKIEKTLAKMKETEAGADLPVLVHTDLRVVNRELEEMSPSFCRMSHLDGNRVALNQLAIHNVVTGCTVMMNRPLAELGCRHNPGDAMMMHDWWLAVIAAAFGKIGFLPEATIDYRQHGSNSVGAKNVYSFSHLKKRLLSGSTRENILAAAGQAAAVLEGYGPELKEADRQMLQAFSATATQGLLKRDCVYWKYKIYKCGTLRILAQFLGR